MSEVLDPPLTHPALTAAGQVEAGLDALAAANLWSMSDDDLMALRGKLARLDARLAAGTLAVTREIDGRGTAIAAGAAGTAGWLRAALRVDPRTAKRDVALAAALDGPLSATGRALAEGTVSLEQARVIQAAMTALPSGVSAELRAQAESFLLEQAAVFDPQALARLGRHLLHRLHPDGAALLERDETEAHSRRAFSLTHGHDGARLPRGRLTPEAGALLDAALDALSAPIPGPDGEPDPRNPGQRRHDGLLELVRLALAAPDMPSDGGEPVTVLVTIPLGTLEARLRRSTTSGGSGQDEASPSDPSWHRPAAQLEDGTALSPETARRLACDAHLVAAVLGAAGEPLDIARLSRTVPTAIRRALVARDRGCAFTGCGRPSRWTHAHHIRHWAHGGPTCLSNLVLLCAHHHTVVHHHGWTVHVGPDGHPRFTPPRWIDPTQTPRPAHAALWRRALDRVPLRT